MTAVFARTFCEESCYLFDLGVVNDIIVYKGRQMEDLYRGGKLDRIGVDKVLRIHSARKQRPGADELPPAVLR